MSYHSTRHISNQQSDNEEHAQDINSQAEQSWRSMPRNKITFDIDTDGIVNASTDEENKITITNDKGRLSKRNIERMMNEVERYRAQDKRQRWGIVGKKGRPEFYCFNSRRGTPSRKGRSKRKCPGWIESALVKNAAKLSSGGTPILSRKRKNSS
ncbi:hypothetical protein KM043_016741 [Ampulex compressa]|nr:hypothetical protein KM043_016741 [Ampulex compressa]